MDTPELINLLHEIDGQLGLAVYRNDHSDLWKNESKELIVRIRKAIIEIQNTHP